MYSTTHRLWPRYLFVLALCLSVLCLAHWLTFFSAPRPAVPVQGFLPTHTLAAAATIPQEGAPVATQTRMMSPVLEATTMPLEDSNPITLTIVYDNNPFDARLKTAWGFACLVETGETTVLFDTGADGPTLLSNMAALGLDPRRVDSVVLSHNHSDHTGGLDALLAANDRLTVYVPRAFAAEIHKRVSPSHRIVQVTDPISLAARIRTTGELGTEIIEQSLIVKTGRGLIVITGCAHPGIVEIVQKARAFGEVYLVMGGFHLGGKSGDEIEAVISGFKRLGVQRVAPCHCTGAEALGLFGEAFGANFIRAGAGAVIVAKLAD